MNRYTPNPIDTSSVELPVYLLELTEKLAENTHDNWAEQRMQEGWTWGHARNDTLKQHPGLIPYADLSDAEKEYDRRTAMETIKAIHALGYRIESRQ